MRRAMRHAHLLGAEEPLMHRLVPTLVAEMGGAYPELRRAEPVIVETLRQEEVRFRATLGRGMALLDEATAGLGAGDVLLRRDRLQALRHLRLPARPHPGRGARQAASTVDTDGFDAAMERQRTMARENWAGSGQQAQGAVWLALRERLGPTQFLGYEGTEATGEVLALVEGRRRGRGGRRGRDGRGALRPHALLRRERRPGRRPRRDRVAGRPRRGASTPRRRPATSHAHALKITDGRLELGARARLAVDAERRARTRLNHSAAHLAHAALKHVLGPHVAQKGQLVDGDRMRFDFSHGAPLTPAEIDAIETEVNAVIRQNLPALTEEMAPQAAIEAGAVALFGEKYGDTVRVLTLGRDLGGDGAYSVELCGGTHVARTGDIALFKIVSEQGIAAGVRRIEALTGEPARRWLLDQAAVARGLADQFRVPVAEVGGRVEALQAQARKAERELADAKRQLAVGGGGARRVGGG